MLWRGQLPAEIVVLIEYPEQGSEVVGLPGMSPEMSEYIDKLSAFAPDKRWAVIPLVGCPSASAPDRMYVRECMPRLKEILQIASPTLIICIGKHCNEAFLMTLLTIPYIVTLTLGHPIAMRMGDDAETAFLRCELLLQQTLGNIKWPESSPKLSLKNLFQNPLLAEESSCASSDDPAPGKRPLSLNFPTGK